MTNLNVPSKSPDNASIPMLATLGGIAMLSGLLVVFVFQVTKPYIEENQRIATQKAVFKVVPGAKTHKEFVVTTDGIHAVGAGNIGIHVFAGYDKTGKLLGVAANAGAQGYADMIHILYGYDPACQCIRGIKVLKTAETPGLGDKIITDQDFQKNFEALDARLNAQGDDLANDIITVKHGTKKYAWQIDAISGATISSRTIGKALNTSARELLPLLQRHLTTLQKGFEESADNENRK
jgi:electron transport complex protein RnfG